LFKTKEKPSHPSLRSNILFNNIDTKWKYMVDNIFSTSVIHRCPVVLCLRGGLWTYLRLIMNRNQVGKWQWYMVSDPRKKSSFFSSFSFCKTIKTKELK
jgi:hypothetical protein